MAAARIAYRNDRPVRGGASLQLERSAEAIRINLAERRNRLASLSADAITLAAQCLDGMHGVAFGRIKSLRGADSPEYRSHQLIGRDALPLEDVCYLAIEAPEVVVPALQALARVVGYRLEPEETDVGSVGREAADVAEVMGKLQATITRAIEAGITADKAVVLDAQLHEADKELKELESALHDVALGRAGR